MRCAGAVGFVELPEPLRGSWPVVSELGDLDFPDHLTLGGRAFTRSTKWAAPYAGVVAQYREDRDRDAMHLLVHADGTWTIDHIDAANPDRGLVLEHAYRDVIHTWWGALLLTGAAVGVSAGLSFALTRGGPSSRPALPSKR